MNLNVDQPDTFITAPDDPAGIVREAIPPPAQPGVVIEDINNRNSGLRSGNKRSRRRKGYYGLSLVHRGLFLLGLAFGSIMVWYFSAWVYHGRMPLVRVHVYSPLGGVSSVTPIVPPAWLIIAVIPLILVSFVLMLIGTQDEMSK